MSDAAIWIALIAASTGAVALFYALSRSTIVRGREPLDFLAIRALVPTDVSIESLRDALCGIGEAFSVIPGLIRPDDTLESYLRADS